MIGIIIKSRTLARARALARWLAGKIRAVGCVRERTSVAAAAAEPAVELWRSSGRARARVDRPLSCPSICRPLSQVEAQRSQVRARAANGSGATIIVRALESQVAA